MTILTKISIYRAYSGHEINTPLSTRLTMAERIIKDHTFPYATMNNVANIAITNSLLINIVENSAFFSYFYPISTQN